MPGVPREISRRFRLILSWQLATGRKPVAGASTGPGGHSHERPVRREWKHVMIVQVQREGGCAVRIIDAGDLEVEPYDAAAGGHGSLGVVELPVGIIAVGLLVQGGEGEETQALGVGAFERDAGGSGGGDGAQAVVDTRAFVGSEP